MLDWFKQASPEPGGFYQHYKALVEELSRLADGWARLAIGEVRPRRSLRGAFPDFYPTSIGTALMVRSPLCFKRNRIPRI
jgi:hypothetical protein